MHAVDHVLVPSRDLLLLLLVPQSPNFSLRLSEFMLMSARFTAALKSFTNTYSSGSAGSKRACIFASTLSSSRYLALVSRMAAGASGRVVSYASHTSCVNARMTSGRLIHSDLMVGSALRTYAFVLLGLVLVVEEVLVRRGDDPRRRRLPRRSPRWTACRSRTTRMSSP